MNALKRFRYKNPKKELEIKNKKLKPNYFEELYPKILTEDAIKYLINRILNHKSSKNAIIKRIGRKFVRDHPEIFDHTEDDYEQNENTDDEDDFKGIVFVSQNDTEKHEENTEEKHDKNDVEITEVKEQLNEVVEEIEEVREQIDEVIEEIKPDKDDHIPTQENNGTKKILDIINKMKDTIDEKFKDLTENTEKKFNDMLDGYIDLRNNIKEKKHLDPSGVKNRLDNIEGKLEMLHGKQMEDVNKSEKNKHFKPRTKEEYLRKFLSRKNYRS